MHNDQKPGLKPTQNLAEHIGAMVEYGNQYIDQKIMYAKLEAVEKGAKISGEIGARFVVFGFVFLSIFFLLFSVGFLLDHYIRSLAISFAIVSLIAMIFGIIVFKLRKKLVINRIISALILTIFENDESE
jgi:hypothetical protein